MMPANNANETIESSRAVWGRQDVRTDMASHIGLLRILSGILVAGWLTPVLTTGLAGLGVPIVPAVAIAVLSAGAAAAWGVWIRRGADWILDALLAGPRIWLVVMFAAAIVACASYGRLTVFMIDSSRVNCSYVPSEPFRSGHSCYSAYAEGARFAAAGGGINIYETALYTPAGPPGARRLIGGNLRVDSYHYPPPFLLAPGALRLVAPEFAASRAIWFMLQSLLIAAALVMVSRWIGGVPGAWAAAAGWLVLASPAVMLTLQQGNFQITVFSLALIAFVLIARGRELSGGVLLAYATVAKIVPGVLVLFLLTTRRWRAVAYIAAFSLILCGLTIAAFGWKPISDFVWYELPKISSGEAFPQTETPGTVLMNVSVYGETVRMRRLFTSWFGLDWFGPGVGRAIAGIYGLIVVLLAAVAGWVVWKRGWLAGIGSATPRPETRLRMAQVVLALLSLTAFRSPFVGFFYGFIGTQWLLTLLAAEASTTMARAVWLVGFGVLAAANVLTPSPPAPQSLIPPPLMWVVATSLIFSTALLLNLGVAAIGLRSADRAISGGRADGRGDL